MKKPFAAHISARDTQVPGQEAIMTAAPRVCGHAGVSRTTSIHGAVTTAIALLFVAFHFYTAGFGQFAPLIQRSVHVGLGLALAYLKLCEVRKEGDYWATAGNLLNALAAILALASCLYVVVEDERLATAISTVAQPSEFLLGGALLVLVLDSARRSTGPILPVLALLMIAYTLFGHWLPGSWGHSEISPSYLIEHLYLSTDGIWGTVTGLSASLITIFIIFGCFLLATNATETFMKVSLIAAGRSPGGAAKVCNVGSAFFGMINGAAVANVATVGNFTIPAMIRLGYRPAFAGAVEATASSGGQITPPVMGAGAFIMAEMLQMPYATVALAAVIPSLLFYVCIWASIDVEARREKMRAFEAADIPTWREVLNLRQAVPLLATVAVMVGTLFSGSSASLAAFYSIVVNVTLFLVIGPWRRAEWWARLKAILEGAKSGAANTVSLVSLLVCAQIILSLIGLTGFGIKLSESIMLVGSDGGLLPVALLTLAVALVLGMGMPTTAAYLLAAAVCAPGLTNIGLPPLSAHFFIFYGALLSALTPPVCTAVYAAAVITQTHWWPVAIESLKLAVMKFALPFFFLYRPEILLVGSPGAIAWVVVVGFAASQLFAIGTAGYYYSRIGWPLRVLCIAAALGMISGAWYMDALGIGLLSLLVAWYRLSWGRNKVVPGVVKDSLRGHHDVQ